MPERQPAILPDALAATKARLRDEVARRVPAAREVVGESRCIADAVVGLPEFRGAQMVGLYLALPGEPATEPLVAACRDQGKNACVPARLRDADGYAFARFDEGTTLARGPFGVVEPSAPDWVDARQIDLFLVPGVAFDAQGNRLGHGKGHYDRMLAGTSAVRVGLALSSQWVDRVPHGPRDLPMDLVVTAQGVRRCRDPRPCNHSNDEQKP